MKIMRTGYSGSGKSTLAKELGKKYGEPVLHLDTVQYLPGWIDRPHDEKAQIVTDFLDSHEGWVIDGNYTKLSYERRMEEADQVIMMLFGRWACFRRCFKRYLKFRNKSRPDMTEGCDEKFDLEFMTWILWRGRGRKKEVYYMGWQKTYPEKTVVLRNQKELDRFRKESGLI